MLVTANVNGLNSNIPYIAELKGNQIRFQRGTLKMTEFVLKNEFFGFNGNS